MKKRNTAFVFGFVVLIGPGWEGEGGVYESDGRIDKVFNCMYVPFNINLLNDILKKYFGLVKAIINASKYIIHMV